MFQKQEETPVPEHKRSNTIDDKKITTEIRELRDIVWKWMDFGDQNDDKATKDIIKLIKKRIEMNIF